MTLSVRGLHPAQLKALGEKAHHAGKTASEYVRFLIERELIADMSFDQILKPVREDFRRSGITEAELDEIVDRARGPRHRKRRGTRR